MRRTLALTALALLVACKSDSDTEDTYDPTWTDADGDGYYAKDDCDDDDPDMHPFNDEVCDGKDNDCDGKKDNDAVDAPHWWQDVDEDGYGDPGYVSIEDCDQPEGYVSNGDDCDDTDPSINPELVWYADTDTDGYGDPAHSTQACEQPAGYVVDDTDCDDEHYNAHPGSNEYCDGYDNDCDDKIDEDDARDAVTWYPDDDGDGYGDPEGATLTRCEQPTGMVDDDNDCDDDDDEVHPDSHATEVPGDGIDTDCDGKDFCTDLDCDGLPDILLTGWSDGSGYEVQSTLWHNADGWTSHDTVDADGAYQAAAVDVDGDGYLDLVFAGYEGEDAASSSSWVFTGGTSGYVGAELATYNAKALCMRDFDSDGNADIFFPSFASSGDYVVDSLLFWGVAYSTSSSFSTTGAWGCAASDVDADGIEDIAVAMHSDGEGWRTDSLIYLSSMSWSQEDAYSLPTVGAAGVLLQDVDDDSFPDVVFTAFRESDNYEPSSVIYLGSFNPGSGTGFDQSNKVELPTQGALDVVSADMNKDGYTDLAFSGYRSNAGGFEAEAKVFYGSRSGYSRSDRDDLDTLGAVDVLARDLDGDGFTDLVFANSQDNDSTEVDSYVYWGSATGYSSASRTDLPTDGAVAVAAGDLDEDGYPDLVFACQGSVVSGYQASSIIYWGDASGYDSTSFTELATTGATDVVIVGD